MVAFLLEKGARAGSRCKDGMIPLHAAVLSGGSDAVVEILLEHMNSLEVNMAWADGTTALHVAASSDRVGAI